MPETRTSQTDPLRIPRVRVGRGFIGMTICPGKKGASQTGLPWNRDLGRDLRDIADAGYKSIVTLMEWNEMRYYHMPHIKLEARKADLDWHHFSIIDRNIPNSEQVSEWRDLSKSLQRDIGNFGGVLIHCLGGLGRTGTVAAMLLQDLGMKADVSISEIRKLRPGAIENELQEVFVQNYRQWSAE